MKIAIVGCGALGSYYGAKLCRAGQDVHFLLRSDYEAVRRNGVTIRGGGEEFNVRPRCARTPEEIGESDLVIIGLKTTANEQFPTLLPPLVGKHTAVLTLQNGLGNEEQLARLFRAEQILGGLCFVCLNRIEPGVICHIDHGLIMLGEFQRPSQPRTHRIAEMFQSAGVKCNVSEDLARAHWEKLVWNIPFNGLGVASAAGYQVFANQNSEFRISIPPGECFTTDKLLADSRWENLARELMFEVIAAANALGHALSTSLADKQIERTRTMGAYKASTLVDFELGRPLEFDAIFFEPLRQAKKAGAATPRLERLCSVLKRLDDQR
jgi:2-dehydropantoate 2-reductase